MANDELQRTKVQALWNHMPEQPYNWRGAATVKGRTPRHTAPLDVPEGWVAPMLRRQILPFAEGISGIPGAGPELDIIDRYQFQLVQAEDLQASRFPNTFLCGRCGLFRSVGEDDPAPACAVHGPMTQFAWAEVHNCGHLSELTAPRCANGCGKPLRLLNTKQFKTRSWYWQCTRCDSRSTAPVAGFCSSCNGGMTQATRVAQTSTYYAQQLTVLNPPTRNDYPSLAHEHVHAAAVAQMIGALPPGIEQLKLAGQTTEDSVAAFTAFAAQIGWKEGNPLYEAGLADAQSKVGGAPAWREAVDGLGLDEERLEVLGEECRQLSLASSAGPLGVDDLLATATGTALEPRYHGYRALFDTYGLADITLLRELPVAFVIAGYTRGSDRALSTTARGDQVKTRFKFFPAKSGKFPMYGVRTQTEGLLVQLDPVKVVSWLVDSAVVADPGVDTPEDARRWLFRIMDPVTDPFNAPENRISEAVLALTHSVSHRLMKALATRCGLNVDSLAEYLFPSNACLLIYANTRSEFILGGLEHVFRYDITDALGELAGETRCVFDPPCRHAGGGACAACLHVFEAACSRFNTVLDRNRLFGSVPNSAGALAEAGEVAWQPYWNV